MIFYLFISGKSCTFAPELKIVDISLSRNIGMSEKISINLLINFLFN
jgi:hypothetical protein